MMVSHFIHNQDLSKNILKNYIFLAADHTLKAKISKGNIPQLLMISLYANNVISAL